MAVLAGEPHRAVADRFSVAYSSPSKWTQRYLETGSFEARKTGGHRPRVLEPHADVIMRRLKETPHITLRGLRDELAEQGVEVSHDTVWRFLQTRGLSHKKACSRLSNAVSVRCIIA